MYEVSLSGNSLGCEDSLRIILEVPMGSIRVPTQMLFLDSVCFCCPTRTFLYANLSNLQRFYMQNWLDRNFIAREFTTWANKIICVMSKFTNSHCFPWQWFLLVTFPVFPVWGPVHTPHFKVCLLYFIQMLLKWSRALYSRNNCLICLSIEQ